MLTFIRHDLGESYGEVTRSQMSNSRGDMSFKLFLAQKIFECQAWVYRVIATQISQNYSYREDRKPKKSWDVELFRHYLVRRLR